MWSVPNAHVLDFPIQMLVRFWQNHHLLDVLQRPLWRVVKGRSESYVARVLESIPDVRTSTSVTSVTSIGSEGVQMDSICACAVLQSELDCRRVAQHCCM